jgi:hypothetical protein
VACTLTYDDTLARVRIDADALCVTGYADTYTRTVTGGWGTADTGQTYTVIGDVASNYLVTGGAGHHNGAVENVFYNSVMNIGSPDCDYRVSFRTNKLTAGNAQVIELSGRFTDIQNMYGMRVLIQQTTQLIDVDLRKRVANVQTVLDTASTGITHVANTLYRGRLQLTGTTLRAKFWLAANSEPTTWTLEATDSSLVTGNNIALRSMVPTGTTNEPILYSFDNLDSIDVDYAIVDRTLDGVSYTTVRGASEVGITTGCELERIVDDYEFPVGRPITYRVRVVDEEGTTVFTTTCEIEVDLDQVWLKSIGRPFLNQPIDCVLNATPITRPARNGINDVVNRSFPVAVTDLRGSRRVPLQVVTQTTEQREDLDLLLASGDPIYVQTPLAYPLPTMYAVIEETAEARPVRNRLCNNDWRLWSLPLVEVAAPGPDVVGSTSTWQTVINTYATWADVMAAHSSWASLLELVGDGTEVIVP